MLICQEPPFIFVHIPRTGGTALDYGLRKAGLKLPRMTLYMHASFDEIAKELPPEFVTKALKFAIVRNPFDRLVSRYCYLRRGLKHVRARSGIRHAGTLSFKEWLIGGRVNSIHALDLRSQLELIGSGYMNYIGRFECFEETLEDIRDLLGVKFPCSKTNVTKHDHYSTYYDEETKDFIETQFADDLKEWEYRFETAG